MDAKMKGMIVTGLMVGCLALGLMAQFNGAWLTETEEADATTGEPESTTNLGLRESESIADAGDEATCEAMIPVYEAMMSDAEIKCDGSDLVMVMALDDICELMDDGDDKDDCESTASAGSTGGMILWVGSIAAILATLMLVMAIAGVEVDAIPDNVGMIMNWAAGGLTILAVLVWYMMLPDGGDMSASTGVYMGVIAGVMGLAAGGMDTFMEADDGGGDAAPAE